jgi:hypothetical protein
LNPLLRRSLSCLESCLMPLCFHVTVEREWLSPRFREPGGFASVSPLLGFLNQLLNAANSSRTRCAH